MEVMDFTVSVLADRPDLAETAWGMPDSWPTFMTHDPIASLYYRPEVVERFADFTLVCQDESGSVVGKAHSIPLYVSAGGGLSDDGWDGAVLRGIRDRMTAVVPNTVCALEIAVTPEMQGHGLSSVLLTGLRENAGRLGFDELIAPVRPNGKTDPRESMSSYAAGRRQDGLPADPWLRVHVRAGGTIAGVAPRSMVIPGTLEDWRTWTGLPFDQSGPVDVPGALAPVLCDARQGTAVYVEPNVWVRHRTKA